MSVRKEYLIGLISWSCSHIWVEAPDADIAREMAEEAWSEDDSLFSHKDGGLDLVEVLDEKIIEDD